MTDPTHQEDSKIDQALGEDWPAKDDFGGKIFRSSQEPDAFAAAIRKDHAAMAAHNEGQPGMPQGPCRCAVCLAQREVVSGK